MVNTMQTSMGTGRGGGRTFSMPQSGFVDKDKEQVQSKSSKVRVYDKISQTGKISPLLNIAALENTIKNLQQPLTEEVRQRSDHMIHQYRLKELSLKKQNEMLQEKLENTKCLLAKKNQRADVENCRLKKQVEQLSKKNGELQETHVKILQEKEEQKMEFESVHLDLQVQISSLSASQMFLEDQTNSLQSEMDRRTLASDEEKVLLKGIVSELKTSLDSLNKDLESSRAMEQEKQGQIVDLQDQLASLSAEKMLLEEETKSLQSEMDRRTSVLEEEKVNLKGIRRDLEIDRDSLNKDLESFRAMEEERHGQIADLRNQLFDSAKAMTCLEQKNNFLITGMIKCREENVLLQRRIREFEFELNCLKKDLEYKDVRLREWIEKADSHLLENGKLKKDLQSKNVRLRELAGKVELQWLENNSLVTGRTKCREENDLLQRRIRDFDFEVNCLKKDLEYKDVRLRGWIEKVESHSLENGKLKKVLQSKNVSLRELTEKVESHLVENEKLKKDIESKDVRLRELTEKVESQLLENGKEKCTVHESESENEKANGAQKKPKANGEIDRKAAQAKSMSEKRTPRQLLKDGTTPKQVAGREMPWR